MFHVFNSEDYFHSFGLDLATTVIWPASVGLLILSTHHQTVVYCALASDILDYLQLRSSYFL
jgi:hypothetical protein